VTRSRIERSIEIDAPVEVAWELASDPRRAQPALTAGQASLRLVSGSFDSVGGRYVVSVPTGGGEPVETEHLITRFEAPRVIETTATSRGTVAHTILRIEPIGVGRSRITLAGEMEWGWSISDLFGRLINGLFARVLLRQSLDRLGAAITRGSGDLHV
jgi:carbon monoxide dehydrogenase subunit G